MLDLSAREIRECYFIRLKLNNEYDEIINIKTLSSFDESKSGNCRSIETKHYKSLSELDDREILDAIF